MCLEEHDVRQLLQRLTDHFSAGGELLFDTLGPWVVRLMKVHRWGIRDARRLERWNPRLTYLQEASPRA